MYFSNRCKCCKNNLTLDREFVILSFEKTNNKYHVVASYHTFKGYVCEILRHGREMTKIKARDYANSYVWHNRKWTKFRIDWKVLNG